jgi:hypothetical protein
MRSMSCTSSRSKAVGPASAMVGGTTWSSATANWQLGSRAGGRAPANTAGHTACVGLTARRPGAERVLCFLETSAPLEGTPSHARFPRCLRRRPGGGEHPAVQAAIQTHQEVATGARTARATAPPIHPPRPQRRAHRARILARCSMPRRASPRWWWWWWASSRRAERAMGRVLGLPPGRLSDMGTAPLPPLSDAALAPGANAPHARRRDQHACRAGWRPTPLLP